MILKGIFALLFLVIIPELLGLIVTKFLDKEKNNLILAFVIGCLIEFAICQLVAVPLIFMNASFTTLLYIYIGINLVLSIVSIYLNVKRLKELLVNNLKSIKEMPKLLTLVVVILVGIQVYGLVGYMHLDDDDAFYVGTAVTSVQTNTIYKYSPTTGSEAGEHLDLRYKLGPFPVYYAIMSEIINIHPTIFAHTIMPIVFLPLAYMVIGLLADCLFKNNKEQTMLFLIFINIMSIWGNYSIRNNFSFLLFRIWQGKSILANIIIPGVWLFYLLGKENDFKLINYIMIFILILAGCLTTTMGIALPPLSLILLVIADEISKMFQKDKKVTKQTKHLIRRQKNKFNIREYIKANKDSFINIAKCLACCMPAIIYGLIYFI